MKNLTENQKVSVLRILLDVVLADGYVDERETKYFNVIAEQLGLDRSHYLEVRQKNTLLALAEIEQFSDELKRSFAQMMGEMIVADEIIHYKEVEIYNIVRHFCNIDIPFDDTIEAQPFLEIINDEPDYQE